MECGRRSCQLALKAVLPTIATLMTMPVGRGAQRMKQHGVGTPRTWGQVMTRTMVVVALLQLQQLELTTKMMVPSSSLLLLLLLLTLVLMPEMITMHIAPVRI